LKDDSGLIIMYHFVPSLEESWDSHITKEKYSNYRPELMPNSHEVKQEYSICTKSNWIATLQCKSL